MTTKGNIKRALRGAMNKLGIGDKGRKPKPRRELAYKLGRWERYTWRRALEQLGVEQTTVEAWSEKRPAWPLLAKELFGRLYTGDELEPVEKPAQWAQLVHDAADELPEFARLLDLCRDERIDSGVAAVALARQLDEVIPPEQTGEGDGDYDDGDDEQDDSGGGGAGGTGGDEGDEDDEGGGDTGDDGGDEHEPDEGDSDGNGDDQDDEGDSDEQDDDGEGDSDDDEQTGPDPSVIRQALREACEQLADEADSRNDAMTALGVGWGNEPGANTVRANHDQMVELAKRLREDKRLVEIAELAGRFEAIARKKKAESCENQGAELVDVTLGRDPTMLLPSELSRMRRRPLRLDLLRRLTQGAALVYEVQGDEWKGRGPMIVAIDVSSSMSGERDRWAKAVALALRNSAAQERRPAHILTFNYNLDKEYTENGDIMALLDVIDVMPSGGTNWQNPLDRGRELIEQEVEWTDADVVLITDGECGTDNKWREAWNAWRKATGASCIGVLIDEGRRYYGGSDGEALKSVCDNVIKVNPSDDAVRSAEQVIEVTI